MMPPFCVALLYVLVLHGVQLIQLVVQSKKANPFVLDILVEEFLRDFYEELSAVSASGIEDIVTSFLGNTIRMPYTMRDEAVRWSKSLITKQYDFHHNLIGSARYVDFLRKYSKPIVISLFYRALCAMTRENLLKFYEKYILASAPNRRKFVCASISDLHVVEVFGVDNDLANWKEKKLIPHTAVSSVIKTNDSMGDINVIDNIQKFKANSKLYPSMIETLKRRSI